MKPVVEKETVPFKWRFNFKKANWRNFAEDLNKHVESIEPEEKHYETFIETVKNISKQHILRVCRTNYVVALNKNSKDFLTMYEKLYEDYPFSENTIEAGDLLMKSLSESRSQKWTDMLGNLDLTQNSRWAWKTIKNLNNDPTTPKVIHSNVTANQIAHQLLLNGKTHGKYNRLYITRD